MKCLGVPHCLSTVALYGKGVLELPMTSLIEKFKCAKTTLEMILSQSTDSAVKNTAPTVKTGRRGNPREVVQRAQGALQHRDIIGKSQSGRAGFGLGYSWKASGKGYVAGEHVHGN